MNHIGEVLRAARKASGLKAKDVAAALGIVPPRYSEIELGHRDFDEILLPLIPEPMRKPVADAIVAEHEEAITRVKSAAE